MKTKNSRCAAFFNLRVLVASLLCLGAGMLILFAVAIAQQPDNRRTTNSSRWLTRLASTLGVTSERSRGGAVKTDKFPVERPPGWQPAPALPYSGPPRDLTPVTAVRSGKLRDMPPIDPETVEKNYVVEPIPPKPPTQSGGSQGPIQTEAGLPTAR